MNITVGGFDLDFLTKGSSSDSSLSSNCGSSSSSLEDWSFADETFGAAAAALFGRPFAKKK